MNAASRVWNVRRVGAASAVAVALVAVSACGSSGSSSAAPPPAGGTTPSTGSSTSASACASIPSGPITFNNILPLSGPTATGGEATLGSDTVAVAYFNAHESICGHKIKLVNLNDKGDPATALNYARKLVSDGDDLMLNDSYSSPQNAIHPYLMAHHVDVFSDLSEFAIVGTPKNPTAFSDGPSNKQYAQVMMAWAKAHNENNIGILSDGTSFGQELTGDLVSQAKADGLTIKKTLTYSPTAVDLTTPLTQLKQAGVQTVMPAAFSGITALAAGFKQIGWSPTIVSWGIFDSYGITASQLPPHTVDLCYIHYSKSILTPTNKSILSALKAKEGLNSGLVNAVLAYTSLLTYQHAIEQAGSVDGAKVGAAIEATTNLPTNIPGVNFSFSTTNHTGFPTSAIKMCTLNYGPFDLLKQAT